MQTNPVVGFYLFISPPPRHGFFPQVRAAQGPPRVPEPEACRDVAAGQQLRVRRERLRVRLRVRDGEEIGLFLFRFGLVFFVSILGFFVGLVLFVCTDFLLR
jgi:hypothetical protein